MLDLSNILQIWWAKGKKKVLTNDTRLDSDSQTLDVKTSQWVVVAIVASRQKKKKKKKAEITGQSMTQRYAQGRLSRTWLRQ